MKYFTARENELTMNYSSVHSTSI